ncbi:hypothetical protein Dimus_010497 [Dionaea muscipula]
MGGMEGNPSAPIPYSLPPSRYDSEDILFCVDVGKESFVEMKNPGPNGRPITRLDSILKSISIFANTKLSINPDHRFAFAVLGQSVSWIRKEFTSEVDFPAASIRDFPGDSSSDQVDLTPLLRIAAHEVKKSRAQCRILRVILFYCRSSMPPQCQWPVDHKIFTFDVIYLHDKPGPDNCPQKVYDALVDVIERVSEHDGYIFESGQGVQRIIFRHMCVLLSYPPQRCIQDDLDVPKTLAKKPLATDSMQADDNVTIISHGDADN